MTNGISLITATGGRQEAFKLLEGYIGRQTYCGPLQWLVVDDFSPALELAMGQEHVPVPWLWQPGDNTQPQNMLALLERVEYDKVLIIEDDEYYGPDYVDTMGKLLDYYDLAGEGMAAYYNIRLRKWHRFDNRKHACFARTGFRREFLPVVVEYLEDYRQSGVFNRTDVCMWDATKKANWFKSMVVCLDTPLSVGIKGMPGRGCINGHDASVPPYYKDDFDLHVLETWLGQDAQNYTGYYAGH